MMIGVLALQGAVREHMNSLAQLGVPARQVKRLDQLTGLDGLILPGGESTAIRLLADKPIIEGLREFSARGKAMFGTCAGMILLAQNIEGSSRSTIGAIDVTVSRNASGRQVDSFETVLDIEGIGVDVPAVFIRAPYITRHGDAVRPLASHRGHLVMARSETILVASFHPELTEDLRIHEYFVAMVKESAA